MPKCTTNDGKVDDKELSDLLHELALSPAFEDLSDLFHEIKEEMRNDPKFKDLMANVQVVNEILGDKYGMKRDN